jgi:hypothetical protein
MAEPSPNGWLQLTVSVPQGRCEAVSEALLAMGATGLQEDHPGLHFDDGDGPLVAEGWNLAEAANPTDEIDLRAWFPGEEDADELARWLKRETGLRPTFERIADQDWNSTWKRSWSPGPLCRRILVVPSWETEFQLAEGQIALRMDPGLAFGTGTHPTTRCCAAFLEELLDRGFLLTKLEQLFSIIPLSVVLAVITQAAIFGFRHSPTHGVSGAMVTGIIGLVFGIAYVAFGRNLWALIIAHCVLNSMSMVERFFETP